MSRPGADERLRRLLALVPWVAANDGPTVEEVCTRFGCTEAQLLADLDLLFVCGVHPFSPDTLIEVDVDEGRVWIRYADWFSRPLRLTAAEGLALVAAGAALLAAPGTDPEGPLARGLAKLAAVLGVDPDEAVEIELGDADPAVLATVRQAVDDRRRLQVEYYSYGRDAWARRTIEPYRVFSAAGQWYVSAFALDAGEERLFRLDRMRAPVLLEERFEPPPEPPPPAVYRPRPDDPVVVLELAPEARWVAERYPVEAAEELGGGRLVVTLRVSERPWLERLLLRLGPAAVVRSGADGVAAEAAARVLARYSGSVQA
ncbi:MAG TPA: WYL domain-containing protein [Acidimicrobiales bacterium]|nr:WYL domain-containing protein [Acidimicrobiales bacterium]